tara:strand:+ start:845 stop:1396 length:552 start_codon:yes stop_codon:yes gene_type:complete
MSMKLIMENFRTFINEEADRAMQEVPQHLYHAVSSDQLDNLRDNGIINLPTELEFEEDKGGVPCALDPMTAQKHGDVVLEIDGEQLAGAGQYTINPAGENGVRVGMTDSASMSGHGVHDMVDKLGTNIPFQFVRKMIFGGDNLPNVRKLRDGGFGGVEIATFGRTPEEDVQTMWAPPEPEEQK